MKLALVSWLANGFWLNTDLNIVLGLSGFCRASTGLYGWKAMNLLVKVSFPTLAASSMSSFNLALSASAFC